MNEYLTFLPCNNNIENGYLLPIHNYLLLFV